MDFCVGLLCGGLIALVVQIITCVIEIRRFNKKMLRFIHYGMKLIQG